MDKLPVELLRLIYSYCDRTSVKSLRLASVLLARVSYEFLLPPRLHLVSWRNDIDRLHSIALHERLQGSIESICLHLGDLLSPETLTAFWQQHYAKDLEVRENILQALLEHSQREACRDVDPLHLRQDDLREAFSALPNLRDLEITFNQSPFEDNALQDVFREPTFRKLDRPLACGNLNAIIFALHGIRLSSFKIDRLPLELFRQREHYRHWVAHAQSFDSLSKLHLTVDPSGLKGPASTFRGINGLGGFLRLAPQLRCLKLAFHPYNNGDSKSVLSFREMLYGFVFENLEDLMLEGISCEEEDLRDFILQHRRTLRRLRLGGRGLAMSIQASRGGIHLHEGTFKGLFTALREKLDNLERLHLEGIFECEHPDLSSHESYNFYPLTDDEWQEVPRPSWVSTGRKTIDCGAFEDFVMRRGPYPKSTPWSPF